MTDSTLKPLPLSSIRIDGGTQCRAAIDAATVAEYCAAIQHGDASRL